MSTEGKKYWPGESPKEREEFEKTRIQDPNEAQAEANMVKAQAEASDGDYAAALAVLEQLKEEVHSPLVEGAVRPLRDVAAGFTALSSNAIDLVGWSLVSILPMPQSMKDDFTRAGAKFPREKLVEFVKELGEGKLVKDYENLRTTIATATEVLERRRAEAEEIAKR